MKFAEHLSAHVTPEWRKQYIEYEALKKMLHMAQKQAPLPEVTEPAVIQRYHASFEERFFQISEKELTKINTFYAEKLAEAQRRLATLQSELEAVFDVLRGDNERSSGQWWSILHRPYRHRARHKIMCDLKLAFSEFYLSLILLQNYQNLNVTGFGKIMKKYDKMFQTMKGAGWQATQVEGSPIYTNKKIDQLITEVESLYTNQLEGGDRARAMKRLRVPPLGVTQTAPVWTTFRVGLQCGIILALMVLIIIKGIYVSQEASVWPLLRAYRGGFIVIEFVFLLGINTYGWRKAGVNHTLIFELDPRNHLSHHQFFELAGFLGVLWCLSLLACLFSTYIHTPMPVNPLVLYGFMLLLLLNPTKTFYYKSRVWLLKVLCRSVTAPFHKVNFADFWLADQLNSMGTVFLDLWSLICFYIFEVNWENNQGLLSPPADKFGGTGYSYGVTCIIQCIPPWIRFAQCLRRYRDSRNAFPHLANAGKYSTVFIMVTFAALYSTEKGKLNSEIDFETCLVALLLRVESNLKTPLTKLPKKIVQDESSAGQSQRPAFGQSTHDINAKRPQLTIGVKVYFYLWAVTSCVSTIFTVGWDLKMDWGLLDKKTKENKYLREETVYQNKVYYYCAMLQDVILRVAWALNILFVQNKQSNMAEIISTTLAPLEVFRRFVWNFFRLENEHLNNCGQFRAVRDISIAPATGFNQAALLLMMDQQEGVRNRGKVKGGNQKTKFSFKWSRRELDKHPKEKKSQARGKGASWQILIDTQGPKFENHTFKTLFPPLKAKNLETQVHIEEMEGDATKS
ncbi:xenotropic and polytropic retrovirus receptor 1-like [Carcharodon carcharias]|uniref:xenotropic and polytropic retrovirus receptor 1-like n=1 Tax=Carcharodon carcharias TaxID=13397 RepID=UPI001B7DA83C|nr:xenotropic and polytropic retrovirus receptor 1-like [Carcharodon carcharias]